MDGYFENGISTGCANTIGKFGEVFGLARLFFEDGKLLFNSLKSKGFQMSGLTYNSDSDSRIEKYTYKSASFIKDSESPVGVFQFKDSFWIGPYSKNNEQEYIAFGLGIKLMDNNFYFSLRIEGAEVQ